MTSYSTACYFARNAADLARFNGLYQSGLCCPVDKDSEISWISHHVPTGFYIALNANGTVNQQATKALRETIADPAPLPEVYQPGEPTPADMRERVGAYITAFALARIAPALEAPLNPRPPALARLAALNAGAF